MSPRVDLLLGSAFVVALALSGCTPFGGSEGELGHGEFFYQCAGGGDIACDANKAMLDVELTSADGAKLPRAMAVGAPFKLIFQGNRDGNVDDTTVVASSPTLAPESDIGFAIEKPATVAFLAMRATGRVSDFIDVTAEEVATVNAFHQGVAVSKISLPVGEHRQVGAYARGASSKPLSGALIWGWSTSDPTVVEISPESEGSTDNEIFIHAVAPGTATLTIKTDGKSLDVPVTVEATD